MINESLRDPAKTSPNVIMLLSSKRIERKPIYPIYMFMVLIVLLVMSTIVADLVVSFLIELGVALSGWVAFLYQYYSDRPKIRGKILQVMRGTTPNPQQPSERLTVFTLFLYLTNMRKNAIHISDYILEVETEMGFERMKIVYGLGGKEVHFEYGTGGEVQIPDFTKGLIYKQSKPVEFGVPFYGYLPFVGDIKYYKADIKRYRITCVDVFGHQHKITTQPKDFVNLFYLQEVFGIKIPTPR